MAEKKSSPSTDSLAVQAVKVWQLLFCLSSTRDWLSSADFSRYTGIPEDQLIEPLNLIQKFCQLNAFPPLGFVNGNLFFGGAEYEFISRSRVYAEILWFPWWRIAPLESRDFQKILAEDYLPGNIFYDRTPIQTPNLDDPIEIIKNEAKFILPARQALFLWQYLLTCAYYCIGTDEDRLQEITGSDYNALAHSLELVEKYCNDHNFPSLPSLMLKRFYIGYLFDPLEAGASFHEIARFPWFRQEPPTTEDFARYLK